MRNKNTQLKRIQLRGISRTPSDRATEDGGVAESLNMQLDEGESAPALKPVPLNEDKHISDPDGLEIVYVHKTATYENLIGKRGDLLVTFTEKRVLGRMAAPGGSVRYDVTVNVSDVTEAGIVGYISDASAEPLEVGDLVKDSNSDDWYRVTEIVDDTTYVIERSDFQPESGETPDTPTPGEPENPEPEEPEPVDPDEPGTDPDEPGTDPEPDEPETPEEPDMEEPEEPGRDENYEDWLIMDLKGASLKQVTSIGNTLIIMTDDQMYYAIFKEGRYKALTGSIPSPKVEIYSTRETMVPGYEYRDDTVETHGIKDNSESDYTQESWVPDYYKYFPPVMATDADGYGPEPENDVERNVVNGRRWSDVDGKPTCALVEGLVNGAWDQVNALRGTNNRKGILNTPIFATVALRLYDGSVYAPTAPVLLGIGADSVSEEDKFRSLFAATYMVHQQGNGSDKVRFSLWVELLYAYRLNVRFGDLLTQYIDWTDVVKEVEIYVSAPVAIEKDYLKCKVISRESDTFVNGQIGVVLDPESFTSKLNERIMDGLGPMYLLKSYDITELGGAHTDFELREDLTLDHLATQTPLVDAFATNHTLALGSAMVYNSHLYGWDAKQTMSAGNRFVPSVHVETDDVLHEYRFTYRIPGEDGQVMVVSSEEMHSSKTNAMAYGFISYPDPRCSSVIVAHRSSGVDYSGDTPVPFETDWEFKEYEMKESDVYDISYCLLGMNKPLHTGRSIFSGMYQENPVEVITTKVLQSESGNPWLFPKGKRVTLSAGYIIGMATATQAISTGQFGEFPIYAFCEDGIWSLSIGTDGSILSSKPLSREKALKGTITPIDHAVVFITDKAVQIVSGSEFTNLSTNMNGRHYSLPEIAGETNTLAAILSTAFMLTMKDQETFMGFMKEAKIAYDYTGSRLIFFRGDRDYQYIYKLDTQTWHKYVEDVRTPRRLVNAINSYPECWISARRGDKCELLNFSTPLDVTAAGTINGVIITRPFDLDAPDVLKKITAVRIRGQFPKKNVKYILLGSQDGQKYHMVHSLFGKTWKKFRMIIVAKLSPVDRITWIDIEYETRFVNKIR